MTSKSTKDSKKNTKVVVMIDSGRKNNRVQFCESRAILELLGFSGVNAFAAAAGVAHETASALLGTSTLKFKKHHYNIIAVHEALHTAYGMRKTELTKAARNYVCDWAKRWREEVVREKLMVESAGRLKEGIGVLALKDRKRKRDQAAAGLKLALDSLEWKT